MLVVLNTHCTQCQLILSLKKYKNIQFLKFYFWSHAYILAHGQGSLGKDSKVCRISPMEIFLIGLPQLSFTCLCSEQQNFKSHYAIYHQQCQSNKISNCRWKRLGLSLNLLQISFIESSTMRFKHTNFKFQLIYRIILDTICIRINRGMYPQTY